MNIVFIKINLCNLYNERLKYITQKNVNVLHVIYSLDYVEVFKKYMIIQIK